LTEEKEEFEAILGCLSRPYLKKKKPNKAKAKLKANSKQ
jgi:hypothetical protein